ncbi:3'-5' exonuclease family protein [Prescottella equi]
MSVDGFVFVDLETTGTVAAKCKILEIGFALYSADLEPVERMETLAVTTGTTALIDELRSNPEFEFVANMHTKNGLFTDLEAAVAAEDDLPLDLSGYENNVVDVLTRWGVDKTTPMCGSSHRMDREFLALYMPKVDDLFSYRSIDASSFREAGMILDHERTSDRINLIAEFGSPTHRVAEDMHHSANLLRVFHGRAPIPFPA